MLHIVVIVLLFLFLSLQERRSDLGAGMDQQNPNRVAGADETDKTAATFTELA
jgi:hypothetical protein